MGPDDCHSSITADSRSEDSFVGKEPVTWREYFTNNVKETQ